MMLGFCTDANSFPTRLHLQPDNHEPKKSSYAHMENPPEAQPDLPEQQPDTPEQQPSPKTICPNCEKKISRKAVFCPKCGQKQVSGKVKMSDLLIRLWNTTFHLESKFLRMVWHLLIPGKVTIAYFRGKIKSYPHPIQFFLVCMFFFLLYVGSRGKAGPDLNLFSLLKIERPDIIKGKVEMAESMVQHWDSIPERLRTPAARQTLDTLMRVSMHDLDFWEKDSLGIMEGGYNFIVSKPYKFANRDLLRMSPDSLLQFYRVEPWLDRLLIRQGLRATNDSAAVARFWVGSFTWILLFQIAVMSFWLKLMYRRQQRYFVEHFVLLIHLHSGFIFLLTLISALRTYLHFEWLARTISLWWLAVAIPLAMYFYYGQSKRKTLLKFLIFCILYALMFFLAILLSFLTSFLFF